MKKLSLLILSLAIVLSASQSYAFSLKGYEGQVLMNFYDWDMGTIWYYDGTTWASTNTIVDSAGSWVYDPRTLSDNVEDTWGIANLEYVDGTSGYPVVDIWEKGDNGEYIQAYFYGLDDISHSYLGSDVYQVTSDALAGGAHVEIYLLSSDKIATDGVLSSPYTDSGLYPTYGGYIVKGGTPNVAGIQGGQLLLDLQFVSQYASGGGLESHLFTSNYQLNSADDTVIDDANAWGYLEVVGGTYADFFDSDYYAALAPGADFRFDSSMTTQVPQVNFTLATQGDVEATVSAIPEPSSMILFGIGLVGSFIRKRLFA